MKFHLPFIMALTASLVSQVLSSPHGVVYSKRDSLLHTRASNWAHWGDRLRTGKVVRGVNLGGWFVLENWMTPELFLTSDLSSQNIPDEWSYSKVLTSQSGKSELKSRLKKHWSSWIVESDFEKMKKSGLNTVRIPIGHWAFNSSVDEPYQGTAQRPFIRQALEWSKKYGLDVVLDLHGVPNSQNGYDNSGHAGPIGFSEKDFPRALDALGKMVEFYVNQDFGGVVKAIELVNEPRIGKNSIPKATLLEYHRQAYAKVRSTMSSNAKTRVTVLISDAFQDIGSTQAYDSMFGEFPPASMAADWHYYEAFGDLAKLNHDQHIDSVCNLKSKLEAQVQKRPVVVGEWSIGTGVSCTPYKDCKGKTMQESINEYNTKEGNIFKRRFFEAQASVFEQGGGWIFWNWKTSSVSDWSYRDAVDQGWIPSDVSNLNTWSYVPSTNSSSCVSPAEKPNRKPTFKTQSTKTQSLLQNEKKPKSDSQESQREWE